MHSTRPYRCFAPILLLASVSLTASASDTQLIHSFNHLKALGAGPNALMQASNGALYGSTDRTSGKNPGCGILFQIDKTRTFSNTMPPGCFPSGDIVQAADGYLYGTVASSSNGSYGALYRSNLDGHTEIVHKFDREAPRGVSLGVDGILYGATSSGGKYDQGKIFSYDPETGHFRWLHSFDYRNGHTPYSPPIQRNLEFLYGVTYGGGIAGGGTLYRLELRSGSYTVLHSFGYRSGGGIDPVDAVDPTTSPVSTPDGAICGSTTGGGAFGHGAIYCYGQGGRYDVIYSFEAAEDGSNPGPLGIDEDGSLIGSTPNGGIYGLGAIFRIRQPGEFEILHHFSGGPTDGASPLRPPFKARDGNYYGTTSRGGKYRADGGTVYVMRLDQEQ